MRMIFLRGNALDGLIGLVLTESYGRVRGRNENHGQPESAPQKYFHLPFFAAWCRHFVRLLIKLGGFTGTPVELLSAFWLHSSAAQSFSRYTHRNVGAL